MCLLMGLLASRAEKQSSHVLSMRRRIPLNKSFRAATIGEDRAHHSAARGDCDRMDSVFHYVAPASPCGYLPEQRWRLEYEIVRSLTPGEYQERLLAGWRRFGGALFRPRCRSCSACQSLRVDVAHFRPDRSMRRVRKLNEGVVRRVIRAPRV